MGKGDDFSLDDLLEFLDYAANNGLMKRNTASAQKAACSQVLGILQDSERSDLRKLDIESAFKRYTNLNPTKLKPSSLKSYRSRVEKAVTAFLSHRKDPTNWKPAVQERRSSRRSGIEGQKQQPPEHSSPTMGSVTRTITLPFPIREDLTITISNIPRDLKVAEAKRLAAFLETLSIDFKPPTQ